MFWRLVIKSTVREGGRSLTLNSPFTSRSGTTGISNSLTVLNHAFLRQSFSPKVNMSLENFQSLPKAQQEKILNGPALQPPPGVTPNLDDPTQYNHGANALLAICLILTVFALSIRAYSRIFHFKSLHVADCMLFRSFPS